MQRKEPFVLGEFYHVYNRGVDKRIIFNSQEDYKRFIILLYLCNSSENIRLDYLIGFQKKKYSELLDLDVSEKIVSIGAWCLMPNHFHLVLKEEVEGGISKFMGKLCTAYSMYFNNKNDRKGPLFSGRFKSKNASNDKYLKHLFGYIHLNPLGIVLPKWEEELKDSGGLIDTGIRHLTGYKFSSFQEYIGIYRPECSIINKDAFIDYFKDAKSFKDFINSYLIVY